MKKYPLLELAVAVVLVASVVSAYVKGREDALIDDFKTYHANLVALESKVSNLGAEEVKEFVKARYYYFGNRIPKGWLPLTNLDHGPVSTNALAGLTIGKGPTTASEEYHKFKEATQQLQARK
jgi:hypothetical protein